MINFKGVVKMLEIPMLLPFALLMPSVMGVCLFSYTVLDYFEFHYAADIALKLCIFCFFAGIALNVLLIAIISIF